MKPYFVTISEWMIKDNEPIKPYREYQINSDHIVFISSYDEKNSQICLSNNVRFLTKGTPEDVYVSIVSEIDEQICNDIDFFMEDILRNPKK
jgi:hypothetical protein